MMKKSILYNAGLVLTILGLMGILSKQTFQTSSYIVFGLGLASLIASYFIKAKK